LIDWQQGGWTGSVNKCVQREVREHFRENLVARRTRYRFVHRFLKFFFSVGTFGRFVGLYILLDVALILTEGTIAKFAPNLVSSWVVQTSELVVEESLRTLASYLITAQVGVLGVISIALALVTLIAQRENSSTDVKVYYHESFALEVVASSIALLAILCAQLFWPGQTLLFWLGLDMELPIFEVGLLGLHLSWLLLNLTGLAHFISTTFGFVQQSEREFLRNRYTANVVQPLEMTQRLRQQFYSLANRELDGDEKDLDDKKPSATFGFDFGTPYDVELASVFSRPTALHDVRMNWVRWVLRRWAARCADAATNNSGTPYDGLGRQSPSIWFTPRLDGPLTGKEDWCRRRGGVPLTLIEKFVLRRAFSFRRTDENA
jgi:hypothetical protein